MQCERQMLCAHTEWSMVKHCAKQWLQLKVSKNISHLQQPSVHIKDFYGRCLNKSLQIYYYQSLMSN